MLSVQLLLLLFSDKHGRLQAQHMCLLQIELRKYLETVYGFSVASLRTLNYEGAKKRGKHGYFRRPDYKKVYVTFNESKQAQSTPSTQ